MPKPGFYTLTCDKDVYNWIEEFKHKNWKALKERYKSVSHNAVLKKMINLLECARKQHPEKLKDC